jgi:hypothetical protein
MYIQKVRLTRSKVAISYRTPTGEDHHVETSDAPLPSFVAAIHALAPLIVAIVHLPGEYAEKLTPLGLTLVDKQDSKLVTLSGKKDLPDSHSPFNISTPLRFLEHPKEEGTYSPALTDAEVALVNEVIEEAKRYLRGERAQGSLPLDSTTDDADDEGEDADEETAPVLKFSGNANENGTPQPTEEKPKRSTPPKRGRKAAAK